MVFKSKVNGIAKGKLTAAVFCAMTVVLTLSVFAIRPARATPTVPGTIPNGNPVNVIWYNNAHASLPTGEMLDELGWVWGDQLDSASAHAMLMIQDGPAARWYIWIYKGGWDTDWGYWSYASVTHYYFDPNPFHWGWYLDDLENPETKLRNQWSTSVTPWAVSIDSYWVNNAGYYSGEWNDGYATRIRIAKDVHEYTANPNFVVGQDKWDRCLYWFNWLPPFNDGDCTDANGDGKCDSDPDNHYILWTSDGVVQMKSRDQNSGDSAGISSRFGQGLFHGTPSYQPILLLDSKVKTLTMEAKVANWGCTYTLVPDWCGIKFDAWIRNVVSGNRLMVEMYWFGYGVNDLGRGDIFRVLGNLYDYIVEIPYHPESVTQVDWASNRRTYVINLLKFFKYAVEVAIPNSGALHPSDPILSNWELYHVAVDVETGDTLTWSDIKCWVDAEMLKVTYGGAPRASFTYSPSNPTNTDTVTFDGSSSSDTDGYIVSYSWNFGDGGTGSGATATHRYYHAGTYTATLTVTDDDSVTNSISKPVTVRDVTPPSNPTGWSSSHSRWVWSSDNTIDMSWWGASDDDTGVYGYSFAWDTSSTTIPDTTVDTTGTSTTSPALASGNSWYFHIRTVDNAGNWNPSALHVGPFYIDITAPSNPTGWSSSHSRWVWSNDNTIYISWSGASDAHSGVYGYSFVWDTSSTTVPDTTVETTGTSTTSPALASGSSWYFHVRTRDNVGNWNTGAFNIGPFYIDTIAPSNPTAWSGSHTIGIWSSDSTIDITWTGASDGHSGLYGYSIIWDTSSTTIPDTTVETTGTSTTSPALASGSSWYFHVRACDNAGNWNSGAMHVGPFYIDATVPSNPSGWSSSHTPNVWSNDNTIYISWSGASDAHSGVYGYSFVWDTSTAIPDTTVDTTGTSTTSQALASGNSWYFCIRTVDNAGNWNPSFLSVGPFYIDTTPPTSPSLFFPWDSYTITDNRPTLTWTAATDSHSGVQSYTLQLDTSVSFNSGNLRTYTGITTTTYEVPTALLRTTWYWRTLAVDAVGNTGAYSSSRSIIIDKIATQVSVNVNPATVKARNPTTISGWLIPTTEIVIESTAIDDPYARYHGMTIDEPLATFFWVDQPGAVIGTSYGSFYYVRQVQLSVGPHYLTYGVSSYVGHWHVKVYINGVLAGEGDTDTYNHLTVGFNVNGLGSKTISLSYSNDGGTTWKSITSVTTGSDGYYSYIWRPTKKGSYIVKAAYSGDSDYLGSSATANLSVV